MSAPAPSHSDTRWLTLRRVVAILLFAQLFSAGIRETPDPDMWWHLRTGELIYGHGVPHYDVFSFTATDHQWVTHEWLSDVFTWGAYRTVGLDGLVVLFAALSAVAFWMVYTVSSGRPYLAGLVAVLSAMTAAPSFGVRPQVFNLLFAAAFVSIIEGFKHQRLSRRALWLLPVLSLLWANVHSAHLFGVALLAAYAFGEILDHFHERSAGRRLNWHDTRLLVILSVICLSVGLVNPNGWHLWAFPFGTLASHEIQENILEWASPDFHRYVYLPFGFVMALGVVTWVRSPTQPSWSDVLLFLGTAAAGLWSRRHIALFAVIATPIIARSLEQSLRGTKAHAVMCARDGDTPPTLQRLRLNWVLLIVALAATVGWDVRRLSKTTSAIATTYPVGAVDFLEREGLASAHGYNTYMWGGYMIWRHVPVFVDGRAELYGNEFLSYYLKTFRMEDDWRKPLQDFAVAYVLLERSNPVSTLLAASGEWRQVYGDKVAKIFVRNEPQVGSPNRSRAAD